MHLYLLFITKIHFKVSYFIDLLFINYLAFNLILLKSNLYIFFYLLSNFRTFWNNFFYLITVGLLFEKMEKEIKENSLPPIFKFSELWNILPFYGTLPKWMWLLWSLNSVSKNIWNENREMFLRWGNNYKSVWKIQCRNASSPDFEYLKHRLEYYEFLYWDTTDLLYIITDNIFDSESNTVFLFDWGRGKDFRMHMSIIHESSIPEYLPAVKCPNFKPEIENFYNNMEYWDECSEYINNQVKKKAVIVKKTSEGIQVQSINSPFLKIEHIQSNIFEKLQMRFIDWSEKYCWCKPTSMIIHSLANKEEIKLKIVKMFETIDTIKAFIPESSPNKDWSNSFKNILRYMKVNQKLKIKFAKVMMNLYKFSGTKVKIACDKIIFVIDKIIIPTKLNYSIINLEGTVKGLYSINENQYIVMCFYWLNSNNLNIQYDSNNNEITAENIEELLNTTELCHSYNVLFRIQDIRQIDISYFSNISIIFKSPRIGKIKVIQNWDKYDFK